MPERRLLRNVIVHTGDPAPVLELLRAEHRDITFTGVDSYDALADAIAAIRPEAVYAMRFAGSVNYPRDALLSPGGPCWISVGGSGVDHLGHWNTEQVTVTNAAGVAAGMMAEHILGGFLHFTLDVPGLQRDQMERCWDARRTVRPMAERTLLIVGLGHTGQALATRAKAFGMYVIGTRARPQDTKDVDEVFASGAIQALWGRADFVAVCTPLLNETRNLVDVDAFTAMKSGTILADVSRGGVVNEAALMEALRSGSLGGAVLDVFETEPLAPDSAVWNLPNTLVSPHCSSVYADWEMNSARMFSENMKRWRAGKPLNNVVDPSRGY